MFSILAGLILFGAGVILATVLPILSFFRASQALKEVERVQSTMASLEKQLREMKRGGSAAEAAKGQPESAIEPEVTDTKAQAGISDEAAPPPRAAAPSSPTVQSAGEWIAAQKGESKPPVFRRMPEATEKEPEATVQEPVERPTATLESRIGGQWTLYVGAVALVLGIAFFVKYAAENGWITETARVLIGGMAGMALLAAGLRFVRRGYPLYGQILCGAGFVVFDISVYAAVNFYALIGTRVAFALFVAITAATSALADRERSPGMALMAVIGGFVTPFLLSTDTDAQVFLFSYDAILVAGTLVLARREGWPALNLVSLFLTAFTISSWADRFYTSSKYLTTELFLTLFCAMFLYALRSALVPLSVSATPSRPHGATSAPPQQTDQSDVAGARAIAAALALAPIGYHLASLAILFDHSLAFLIYLALFTLLGLVAAMRFESPGLRLAIWMGGVLPFLGWLTAHSTPTWFAGAAAMALALYGMHLTAQVERIIQGGLRRPSAFARSASARPRRSSQSGVGSSVVRDPASRSSVGATDSLPLHTADIWLIHLNGLALFAATYLLFDTLHPRWLGSATLVLAVWHGGLAFLARTRVPEAATNALAVAFTLLALAIGIQLSGAWLTVGWATEGAAVIWVGLRSRREWIRFGGTALLAFAIGRLLMFGFFDTPAGFAAILNARVAATLSIVGLLYAIAWVHSRSADQFADGRATTELKLGTTSARPPDVPVDDGRATTELKLGTTSARPTKGRREVATAIVAANVLTVLLLTAEINSYWDVRQTLPTAALARRVMLSLAWATYAVVLIAIGIQRRYAPIRYFAIGLVAITVVKVFLVDLSELAGIYRVLGLVAFGGALLLASYLYQRFRALID